MAEPRKNDNIRGPEEDEDGNKVAEDGGEVTDEIEEIYEFDEEKKEENKSARERDKEEYEPKVVEVDGEEGEIVEQGQAIMTDVFQVPKKCDYCYLQDKCEYYEEGAECYYQNEVNIQKADHLLEIMKMAIEMQSERVMFGRLIEQTEGGYPDKNVSEEIKHLTEMIEQFKDLVTNSEEITIKFKGAKAVQESSGVLSNMFGNNDNDDEDEGG